MIRPHSSDSRIPIPSRILTAVVLWRPDSKQGGIDWIALAIGPACERPEHLVPVPLDRSWAPAYHPELHQPLPHEGLQMAVIGLVVSARVCSPRCRRLLPVGRRAGAARRQTWPAASVAEARATPPAGCWRHPYGFQKPRRFSAFFRHLSTSSATSCHLVSQAPETTETGPAEPVSSSD